MTNSDDGTVQSGKVSMGPNGDIDLDNLFSYHPPHGDQVDRYQAIRGEGFALAEIIALSCPASPERSIAIQKVREAVMWANASIACNEPEPEPAGT
jgi:hypothetical protein